MQQTKIEWTTWTWNYLSGCYKVSTGCKHCYAETIAERFRGSVGFPEGFLPQVRWHQLMAPLYNPKIASGDRVFVNSMGDTFLTQDEMLRATKQTVGYEAFHMYDITDAALAVMALQPSVTFQVLTKRPDNALHYLESEEVRRHVDAWYRLLSTKLGRKPGPRQWCKRLADFESLRLAKEGTYSNGSASRIPWPLPNVWLGTSVENRRTTHRLTTLCKLPAARRFVSFEPLLEDVMEPSRVALGGSEFTVGPNNATLTITNIQHTGPVPYIVDNAGVKQGWEGVKQAWPAGKSPIHWCIVGGESGKDHRPFNVDWARNIRDWCNADGIAFYLKQLGGHPNKHGSLEDFPADLRLRQYPTRAPEPMQICSNAIDGLGRFDVLRMTT